MKLTLPGKIFYGLLAVLMVVSPALADQRSDLLQQISDLTNKLNSARDQANTLSGEISYLNNQIQITQLQIQEKQSELDEKQSELDSLNVDISGLSDRVTNIQSDLNSLAAIAVQRVRLDQAIQAADPFAVSVVSGNFLSDATNLTDIQYLEQRDQKLFDEMSSTKSALDTQKATLQDKQAQVQALHDAIQADQDALLASQRKLSSQKSYEAQLLSVTKGNEAVYQTQLAAANAALAALSRSIKYITGGTVYPHWVQTDSWGTYFNQSDAYWAYQVINSPNYNWTISQVGCTLTSLAMVYTHFGYTTYPNWGVATDPSVIASDSKNFWDSEVFWGPSAPPGHTPTEIYPSISNLRQYLPTNGSNIGDPTIIVGMNAPWGPHWVVFKYWDSNRGDFIINDPGYQNAMNVPFTSHYSYSWLADAWLYR